MKKSVIQFIKFNLVSASVTVVQLVLVNVLFWLLKDWKAPLPGFLASVFNEAAVGAGNANWGYVLPFFLSNVLANIYGFFANRKVTFHSDAPKRNVIIFLIVISILILVSTWIQGRLVYLITENAPQLTELAPTLAAFAAGTFQFLILFPLEKYVLLKERTADICQK